MISNIILRRPLLKHKVEVPKNQVLSSHDSGGVFRLFVSTMFLPTLFGRSLQQLQIFKWDEDHLKFDQNFHALHW